MKGGVSKKRQHKTLTIVQKIQVLDKIKKKISYTKIAEQFGIGRSTISDIKNNENKIRQFHQQIVDQGMKTQRKTMRQGDERDLETALFVWFRQKRSEGMPMSGHLIKHKCEQLYRQIYGEENSEENSVENSAENGEENSEENGDDGKKFKMSNGWLWRFCKRHNIRGISIQGEQLSADFDAADEFVLDFNALLIDEKYTRDQVFNADESSLYYRLLPQRTLASHFEKTAKGTKTQKDRITFLLCSNASGSIKIPIAIIGKAQKPHCLRKENLQNLPCIYYGQKSSWMTRDIFHSWFHNYFVKIAKQRLIEIGQEPRALLLIDNCPAHPETEQLKSQDGQIKTEFLSPNVTSLIQPMDQGPIAAVKKVYRYKLLKEMFLMDCQNDAAIDSENDDESNSQNDEPNSQNDAFQFLKTINIKKVIYMFADCWDEINQTTLHNAWKKLLGDVEEDDDQNPNENENDENQVNDFIDIFADLGFNVQTSEVNEWLDSDEQQTNEFYSDDQLLQIAQGDCQDDDDDEIEPEKNDKKTQTFSHAHIAKNFDECLTWLNEQEEATPYNITQLRQLRELAFRKRCSSSVQVSIAKYFK